MHRRLPEPDRHQAAGASRRARWQRGSAGLCSVCTPKREPGLLPSRWTGGVRGGRSDRSPGRSSRAMTSHSSAPPLPPPPPCLLTLLLTAPEIRENGRVRGSLSAANQQSRAAVLETVATQVPAKTPAWDCHFRVTCPGGILGQHGPDPEDITEPPAQSSPPPGASGRVGSPERALLPVAG